jgi:hypothetical protein
MQYGNDRKEEDTKCQAAMNQSVVAASLFIDYIFLDTDERRRMATNPHEYLIEQLQHTGDESVGSSSNKIKLNFNHPCKELIWVVQKDEHVDYCKQYKSTELLYMALGAQPFNYTDSIDALPPAIHAFGSREVVVGGSELNHTGQENYGTINTTGLFESAFAITVTGGDPGREHTRTAPGGQPHSTIAGRGHTRDGGFTGGQAAVEGAHGQWSQSGRLAADRNADYDVYMYGTPTGRGQAYPGSEGSLLTDAGVFVLAETALDMHCWGENPVVTAKLQLNGQDRFSDREGNYFNYVQPWQHHTRSPDTGINVYSFALRPEEHQPSGTCNFSRIDNAYLTVLLSGRTIMGTHTAKIRVYAINYNVLRIMSGMGGLAYSN